MTAYTHELAIVCPLDQDARINTWMQRNGYGPDNVKRHCIAIDAADDAETTHLCGSSPVDNTMMRSVAAGMSQADERVVYALGARGDDVLAGLLEAQGLRLKPIAEEE